MILNSDGGNFFIKTLNGKNGQNHRKLFFQINKVTGP
jgi:hypothetical protein